MPQVMPRFRWPADPRNLNTNKPLPALNNGADGRRSGRPPQSSGRSARSPKSGSRHSPIPAIAVDKTALHASQRASRFVVPASTAQCRPFVSARAPRRMPTQHIIAVMDFLEQQECEMRAEVQRVAAQIRDLRRCVRAVKRERRKETEVEGSGSDADTEEVSVVVIAAD